MNSHGDGLGPGLLEAAIVVTSVFSLVLGGGMAAQGMWQPDVVPQSLRHAGDWLGLYGLGGLSFAMVLYIRRVQGVSMLRQALRWRSTNLAAGSGMLGWTALVQYSRRLGIRPVVFLLLCTIAALADAALMVMD
jgi:hypothetical protein